MAETPTVSVVVPTYNEAETLPRLVDGIRENLPLAYEIIVVDDGSPDGTADLARELGKTHPIWVIDRGEKRGLGSAIRTGVSVARADIVAVMDADLSHDPAHLPALIETVVEGADLALGSRYVAGGDIVGWSAYRRLVSGVGNGLARTVLGIPSQDATTGFRVYGPAAKPLVSNAQSEGYAFQVEILFLAKQAGLTLAEAPIRFENRQDGKSKLGTGEFVGFLGTIGRLRFTRRPPTRRSPRRDRA